jgi:PAS domain S-box-containing protein
LTDGIHTKRALGREQLELILREVGDAITVQDAGGALLYANAAAAALLGFDSAEELLDTPIPEIMGRFELLDEAGAPFPVERLPSRAALQGSIPPEQLIRYRIRATGEERWSVTTAKPVFDDDGNVDFVVNLFHDVTARKLAEERVHFLGEASTLLSSSLDYARTLARLAALVVPAHADWCAIHLLDETGNPALVTLLHADEERAGEASALASTAAARERGHGVAHVIRTGQAELLRDLRDDRNLLEFTGGNEQHADALRALGLRSSMIVPLRSGKRVLGALTLVTAESGRTYDEEDLALAEDLGRRAAVAVENARLLDATERAAARSEEALALLDTLVETAPVGLGYWDRDLRFVRVNRTLAEINGLSPEEHVGKTLRDVIPELAATLEPIYRRVIETGEPFSHVELTGETAAAPGDTRHWVSSYYPVRTAAGEIIGLGAVVSEVTERHQAEEERARLLAAEREARREAEATREQLTFVAEASRILASSLELEPTLQQLVRLFVPEPAEVCTIWLRRGDRLLSAASAAADEKLWRAIQDIGEGFSLTDDRNAPAVRAFNELAPQVRHELPNLREGASAETNEKIARNRALGLRSSMSVPLIARGEAIGALTCVSREPARFQPLDVALAGEIAARAGTAIENALLYEEAEGRARASQALAFVGDGVVLVDREGIVRLWNPAAELIFGRLRELVEGRLADEAIPGWSDLEPLVPISDAHRDLTARAETLPLEVSGRELWLSISGVNFAEGTVYAFRDVTAERGLERIKSEFVSTVSHELRTPLAAIYGAAVTLRRSDLALRSEQRDDLLGVIAAEAERLARTINDVLWASRAEAGTIQVAIESCDPGELARGVVDAARLNLPARNELELEVPDDLPPVAADPDRVRQVLANVVDNAVKYSPDGGVIRVSIVEREHRVRFVITDQGLGIPPAERDRVFEKFYRLDADLTRGVGGTGLGLYISRELVRRMEGRMWVEGNEGPGSTFCVELPVARL